MSSASQPSITTVLAMSGMPSGRGRKKSQVPRKRAKTRSSSPHTVMSAPHSLLTPSIQPLASTISSSSTARAPPGMHEVMATKEQSGTSSHPQLNSPMYQTVQRTQVVVVVVVVGSRME